MIENCRFCGGMSKVENGVCANCRLKIPAVHKFLKEAQKLRERLDALEKKELRKKHYGGT